MKTSAITAEKPGTIQEDEVMLYHSSSSRQITHLITENRRKTLCGEIQADYNLNGEINGNKTSPYRGPDRVLNKICKHCLQKVTNQ